MYLNLAGQFSVANLTLSGTFQNNVSDFFRTLGFAMLDVNFYPCEKCVQLFSLVHACGTS